MCDRCTTLEHEVAILRDLVGMKTRADIMGRLREGLGLTSQQARLLLILYRFQEQIVPFADLLAALPARYTKSSDGRRSEHYLAVTVYQMRRSLPDAWVKTVRGSGYALTALGAAGLREVIAGAFMMRDAA